MALLAGTLYDPAASASVSTSALLAMTAIDTTNLRLTFTAPANSAVLVRLCTNVSGASTTPKFLLGILDGATVKARVWAIGSTVTGSYATGMFIPSEAVFVVSGLTPGNSYTWDAAYGVEAAVASTVLKWGGANDTAGADAGGGFAYEIWDTSALLGSVLYDPSTAASKVTTSLLAMTALDTTNARITFTGPASGKVFWRIRVPAVGSATYGQMLLGILDGATVKARVAPLLGMNGGAGGVNTPYVLDASGIVAVTPTTSYTWDAAYAVQLVAGAGGVLKWGGPNNTTTIDAWGGLAYEIWAA